MTHSITGVKRIRLHKVIRPWKWVLEFEARQYFQDKTVNVRRKWHWGALV